MTRLFFIALMVLPLYLTRVAVAAPGPLKRDYHGFTLWLDCETHHGAVAFTYEIGADRGNVSLKNKKYRYDKKVPIRCQPQSWRSYRTTTVDPALGTWDRGHLVPANHMDHREAALIDTFLLTNTLPQSSTFRQTNGAWYQTEIITECYRDITSLKVWGGVIWGQNKENDFFTVTHGIKTPDRWWKLIYRKDKGEYVAWLFPNHPSAKAANIDDYLISIKDLRPQLDFIPDLGTLKDKNDQETIPISSWPVTRSGDKLTCEGQTTSIR